MSMYRNQLILHINNWKYTINFSVKEVIRNLKSDYMSMYRNQHILHIINCKYYTFNFYLKEVIRNLKYLRENDVNLT